MGLVKHPRLLLLFCMVTSIHTRSSQISDLKSKISGVEELLEEFRKQLQQDQTDTRGDEDVVDVCLGDFNAVEEHIIRARASIEQGATFLSVPDRVYSWKDCLHACCADTHCTLAVVQEDMRQSDDSLSCYLFNCTYRSKNVCLFAPQAGFSTYSRAHNTTVPLTASNGNGDANKLLNLMGRPEINPSVDDDTQMPEMDEPPRSDAGQDVVIQLPTDWAVLDGRDSVDDHGVTRYEWAQVKGDQAINMKVTHPGLLKISGLQEGVYTFQMTVTDTQGQKSSDNVTVTVLAPERQAEVCTGHCSRYQFMCDDGCCIDITYACDGKQQCPDRSDEAFCQSFDGSRKSVTHPAGLPSSLRPQNPEDQSMAHEGPRKTMEGARAPPQRAPQNPQADDRSKVVSPALSPPSHSEEESPVRKDPCAELPSVGPCKGIFPRWFYDPVAKECKHFIYGGCQGNHNNFLSQPECVNECMKITGPAITLTTMAPAPTTKHTVEVPKVTMKWPKIISRLETDMNPISKPHSEIGGHPVPESGAILPLALGLIITALLLLMIGCRLRMARHKLKKARPLTTEESDYLINGMYL
ncbi:hypothetical protein UPYG_G00251240 [Umbra pygmaea]|uniref:Low-density lipoprotein receptor-related protein 11 n=1 Tax=Umbra pygmaea TaxID=75934 RepID=A0ABD0W7K5_UMBPY